MRHVLAAILVLLPGLAFAQSVEVAGRKLGQAPVIDGNVQISEWGEKPSGEGFVDEQTGAPQAEGGQFWIAYDKDAIYFAAKIEVSGRALRADEFRDNVSLGGDDAIFLGVEPFGQVNGLNWFGINSRGATSIEISGGRAAKREWLGEFKAMGRRTVSGYEVEARIPWGVMRLPGAGVRDLRINVVRTNPVTGREGLWRFLRTNPENLARWTGVDVPNASPGRMLKLLPYVYAGADDDGHIANAGLDVKTNMTDQIEAVGTINPDFRNIENQILSLDFSYFERLAGETRPFFLEGGQFFQTSRDAPLFAPQRIRSFDAGFKTFGKLGDATDFAILDTVDFGERNSMAARLGHRFSETDSASVALTSLGQKTGPENDAWFASYFAQRGAFGYYGQWSETKDSDAGAGRRINTGMTYGKGEWSASAEYLEISPDYAPRLGFAPRRDLRGFSAETDWLRPIPKGDLMEYGFGVEAGEFRKVTGGLFSRYVEASTTTTWRNGADLDFFGTMQRIRGNDDHLYGVSLDMPRGNSYRYWSAGSQIGRVAGRRFLGSYLSAAYRPLPTWQVKLSVETVRHFENETQTILSTNYDLNKSDSFSGRAVRVGNDTNFYLAYRRAGNRGAEYFVILGDPNARTFRASLVLKATFPFELKL